MVLATIVRVLIHMLSMLLLFLPAIAYNRLKFICPGEGPAVAYNLCLNSSASAGPAQACYIFNPALWAQDLL